jgi:plastocyanin
MRISLARFLAVGALALATACDAVGIARPAGNDGSCAGSNAASCQPNTGTQSFKLSADHTVLKVGEGVGITATFGGMTLNGTGNFLPATISDSSVISASAFGAYGLAVGQATLTASYEGTPATLEFSVMPNADGVSAIVLIQVFASGVTAWVPVAARVHAGWTVRFSTGDNTNHKHNVVFEPVPGAPADVALGLSGLRVFTTAGPFTYSCTIHGETGVVNVVSP